MIESGETAVVHCGLAGEPGMKRFWIVVAILAVAPALAGCATQAQVQAQAIGNGMRSANSAFEVCATAAYNDPAYAVLTPRLALRPADITLQQMASTDKVSDAEIAALYARHDRVKLCRDSYIAAVNPVEPGMASIVLQSYVKIDTALIALIQKKTTWGEYATATRDISAQTMADATREAQRLQTALERSHEAELARRQEAFAALSQYSQTQQLINTLNTPAPAPTVTPQTCRTILVGNVARTQCY